jgi:short subunit dehydrogenase-like uncharacterized protein
MAIVYYIGKAAYKPLIFQNRHICMREFDVIVYGAYGYTGTLICDECKLQGLKTMIAGRDAAKLQKLSQTTGFAFEAVDINDHHGLTSILQRARLVIHCAGPFQQTAKQMISACLEAETHYTDITGEFTVFELLAGYDQQAKQKNIVIMPGTGFDVVPTDCLAVHLKNRLPEATHLQLAFAMSKGEVSRGTARTMVEGLGYGGMIRKDRKLTPLPLGDKTLEITFCDFTSNALCIPWGDISTAWRSTGIPNIEVYSAVPKNAIRMAKLSRWVNWLLRKSVVKRYLLKKVDARPAGPDEQKRNSGKSFLWGRVIDSNGNAQEAKLKTLSGYLLTSKTSVLIARKILTTPIHPGYFTPAQQFGESLIFEVPGTEWC